MNTCIWIIVCVGIATVGCKPLIQENEDMESRGYHKMTKRFISQSSDTSENNIIDKIRVKRSSEEECEKLQLCKLHARASQNFFAAFELYFVNKENARQWDHQMRSVPDCKRRYQCYG